MSRTYKQPRQRVKITRGARRHTNRRTRQEVRRSCFLFEENIHVPLREGVTP